MREIEAKLKTLKPDGKAAKKLLKELDGAGIPPATPVDKRDRP